MFLIAKAAPLVTLKAFELFSTRFELQKSNEYEHNRWEHLTERLVTPAHTASKGMPL